MGRSTELGVSVRHLSISDDKLHFLITCSGDALNVNASRSTLFLKSTEKCSNHEFLLEQLEITQRRVRGPTVWKDMLKNALRDIANWRIKIQSTYTKSQVLVWMITVSRNLNQLENFQK